MVPATALRSSYGRLTNAYISAAFIVNTVKPTSSQRVYHVVCHDCPFEGMFETAATAAGECDGHDADHRVSQLEIKRPGPPRTV